MRARRALAIVMAVTVTMVVVVVVVMVMVMMMPVGRGVALLLGMIVRRRLALDPGLTLTATAYRTHHSYSA